MTARRPVLAAACLMSAWPASGFAQHSRIRLDAGAQVVSFRGLTRDSIPVADAVIGASGGQETKDGFAVRCGANGYCLFLRPGPVLRAIPVTSSASVVLWGLGVEGLAFHATGRLVGDAGRDRVWPATTPSAQLLEGYFEYQRAAVVARAGRLLVSSRLEPLGFDGGHVRVRWDKASLDVTGYGGWGLGQATALSATSPALNPLDEWRPRHRQIVTGADVSWLFRKVDLRAEYRRELDPEDSYIVSERTALSLGASLAGIRAVGGIDYNMAEGRMGSADMLVTYLRKRYSVSGGVRRYQPYFSLWTLWGAFSPVPYNAANASLQFRPASWLKLQGRGEVYRYENADISTAIVPPLENGGWRTSIGATATVNPQWTVDANYSVERGPGASGRFADGSVTWVPNGMLSFNAYGGSMARPLELRYYDASSHWIGGRSEWQLTPQQRLWADLALVDDSRERPDAGAASMTQFRFRGGVSLAFGSKADRVPLPPARPRDR